MTWRVHFLLMGYMAVMVPVSYQLDRLHTLGIAIAGVSSICALYAFKVFDRRFRKLSPSEVFEDMVAQRMRFMRRIGQPESPDQAMAAVLKQMPTFEFVDKPVAHFCSGPSCRTCHPGGRHRDR